MRYAQNREEFLQRFINRKAPIAANPQGHCQFSHEFNGGCAIGCEINSKLAKSLDFSDVSIMLSLPKRMRDMGEDFLTGLQTIHDCTANWNNARSAELRNGIVWSNFGICEINRVIKEYEMDIPLLEKHKD